MYYNETKEIDKISYDIYVSYCNKNGYGFFGLHHFKLYKNDVFSLFYIEGINKLIMNKLKKLKTKIYEQKTVNRSI